MSLIVCFPGSAARQPEPLPCTKANSMGCSASSEVSSTSAKSSVFNQSRSKGKGTFCTAAINRLRIGNYLIRTLSSCGYLPWPRVALGNLAQEILFADFHPAMPQNGVCNSHMKIDIGEHV